MTMRWAMAAVAAVLVLSGCTGDSGTATGEATGTATGEAAGSTSPAAGGPASTGADGSAPSGGGGGAQCVLGTDKSTYELAFRHDGEASNYLIEVDFLAGDQAVFTDTVVLDAVQPGELVREVHFASDGTNQSITRCRPAKVVPTPVYTAVLVGADDVSACQNLRQGEFGGYAYDLTFTNRSTSVPAQYAAIVAVRNSAGERRASRLVYAKSGDGGFADVAPGETWAYTDDAASTVYEAGNTCEVVSVDKYTEVDFFADGATTGSLDADIGFATGSAELTDDAKLLLEPAVDQIAGSSEVCVEGFADSVGADADNLALSQARADAVADFLSVSGVTAVIQAMGRGESEAPADDVDDPALRRVDITLSACPA